MQADRLARGAGLRHGAPQRAQGLPHRSRALQRLGLRHRRGAARDVALRHRRHPHELRQRLALPAPVPLTGVRMKISEAWLKEFVAVDAEAAELAERLSF